MGRRRKPENALYPAGLYPSKGWLFAKLSGGGWERVCRVEEWPAEHPNSKAARDRWAELTTGKAKAGTVAKLLDAYMVHREQLVREGKLAKRTLEDNYAEVEYLKAAFGSYPDTKLNSRHCAGYLQKRTYIPKPKRNADGVLEQQEPRRAPVRANREMSLLSGAYTWALTSDDFPHITMNPCVGVLRNREEPSERCPEVWELEAAKKKASAVWALIFDFAYKCGQRGVQTRLLTKRAIRQDGVFVGKKKNGEDVVIDWDDELIAIVLGLLEYTAEVERSLHITSPYIIVSRNGQPYSEAGWKNAVYRIVRAAIADQANPLEVPFSFHNIRARSGTDEEEMYGRSAQHRLGHKRRSTTDLYIRGKKTRRVKPLPLRKAS
jgi:hypothetical protein